MASGCKVDRVIEQYGLRAADPVYESLDEGLLARWTGADGRTEMGYRSVTEWFNKRLLKRVYDEHGRETLGARLDSDYEVLQHGDELVRAELLEALRTAGIDGDGLADDLVSWGTMRNHLQECLDGEKAPETASTDWEVASVETAVGVTEAKTEEAVAALASKGRLAGGNDAAIDVAVRLTCGSCPTRAPFEVALERGYVCEDHATEHVTPDRP
jgi:hypothetical protein